MLPYIHAEKMEVAEACKDYNPTNATNARYRDGWDAYNMLIRDALNEYLSKVSNRPYDGLLTIAGTVAEDGSLKTCSLFTLLTMPSAMAL